MVLKDLSIKLQPNIEYLSFQPARGLRSPHLQTTIPIFFSKGGDEPPSIPYFVNLEDGDRLYCKMSTPHGWEPDQKTVVLVHGLGGTFSSVYMIRMSRKLYNKGMRVLRVNLRGNSEGIEFATRPYHGGTSQDILEVLHQIKNSTPKSPVTLIGYSLGGNISLKLLGELGDQAKDWIEKVIAICPPIDLKRTQDLLLYPSNHMYHRYYVKWLRILGRRWLGKQKIHSIFDFDTHVTAPYWGFKDPYDYYQQCSSKYYLSSIKQKTYLILAKDDPFVDYQSVLTSSCSSALKICLSKYGGHMGFWGWSGKEHRYQWLDAYLLSLVD